VHRGKGDKVSARYDANPDVYIGCGVTVNAAGKEAQCFAKDAQGDEIRCRTTVSNLISTIESAADFNHVSFLCDANDTMLSVTVINSSVFLPVGLNRNP
jgi:hypothetical protein